VKKTILVLIGVAAGAAALYRPKHGPYSADDDYTIFPVPAPSEAVTGLRPLRRPAA
jgi:hypothetical protein